MSINIGLNSRFHYQYWGKKWYCAISNNNIQKLIIYIHLFVCFWFTCSIFIPSSSYYYLFIYFLHKLKQKPTQRLWCNFSLNVPFLSWAVHFDQQGALLHLQLKHKDASVQSDCWVTGMKRAVMSTAQSHHPCPDAISEHIDLHEVVTHAALPRL